MSEQNNTATNAFTTRDFIRKRYDAKSGVYTEVDYSPAKVVKHQVFDNKGQLLDKDGTPATMSDIDKFRAEERARLAASNIVYEHNSNVDAMVFHINRAREDMSSVIERLHKHVLMLESSKEYRETNLADYFKDGSTPSQTSHNKDLIQTWHWFMRLVSEMQNEIDRVKSYDNLKQQNKK